MSLKDTINNTNTQKENTKKVATQIDNKLVELGGEQAENLSDVANKMGAMVIGNYKKIAEIESNIVINQRAEVGTNINIPLNINFIPNIVVIIYKLDNGIVGSMCNKDCNLNETIRIVTTADSTGYLEFKEVKKEFLHLFIQPKTYAFRATIRKIICIE